MNNKTDDLDKPSILYVHYLWHMEHTFDYSNLRRDTHEVWIWNAYFVCAGRRESKGFLHRFSWYEVRTRIFQRDLCLPGTCAGNINCFARSGVASTRSTCTTRWL